MLYIGVDLGGTGIKAGLVDDAGKILKKGEIPTGVGRHYTQIIKDMADLIVRILDEAGLRKEDIHSIGIGSPGVADKETGVLVFVNNLYWRSVPIREELQKHIDLPVYIDNDANAAGLAESTCGACKGYDNSMTLTLGTGVGSGIIINGKPYSGAHGVGAELGHLIVQVDGIQCTCGNRGCLERYASATALIREGRRAVLEHPDSLIAGMVAGDPDKVTAKTVVDAARQNDRAALEIFNGFIYYLAMGIITIINSFDPGIIAIGGGVAKAGDFLLNPLKKQVEKHIFYKDLPYAQICLAQLGNDAGIIGAAMFGKLH